MLCTLYNARVQSFFPFCFFIFFFLSFFFCVLACLFFYFLFFYLFVSWYYLNAQLTSYSELRYLHISPLSNHLDIIFSFFRLIGNINSTHSYTLHLIHSSRNASFPLHFVQLFLFFFIFRAVHSL